MSFQRKRLLPVAFLAAFLTFGGTAHAQKVYSTEFETSADVKVYFVDYKSSADLVIYFTDRESEAGWQNKSKKQLMY